MDYFLRPMSPEDAQAVVRWRYPAEYAFYNMDADPDDRREFLDCENWEPDTKFAVTDRRGELVGFFEFTTRKGETEIGLGLRPDLTGHGLGAGFLRAGLRFALGQFKPRRLVLAVATFNQRAINLYAHGGFAVRKTVVQEINGSTYAFVEMEADPGSLQRFLNQDDSS